MAVSSKSFSCQSTISPVSFSSDIVKSKAPNMKDYVSSIAKNQKLCDLAKSCELSINTVSWDDTRRSKDSCLGPNISDLTLVMYGDSEIVLPIIRKSNYEDITTDIKINEFLIPVGNETNSELKQISLKEYLENINIYTKNPNATSLYNTRDEVILTSAQFCILPKTDTNINFNVKILNYQSYNNNPAVLVITVTNEGTSTQVITEDWQDLYFNKNGMAYDFSANCSSSGISNNFSGDDVNNCIAIFQIPLKNKSSDNEYSDEEFECESSDIYDASITVGNEIGVYIGTQDRHNNYYKLERDERYPIRCTLQYYQMVDNPNITSEMFSKMHNKISDIYAIGTNTGSLVTFASDRKTDK